MEVCKTTLPDVWLIKPDVNKDLRGDYVMTYNEDLYFRQKELPHIKFIEHDISTSIKNVLRGLHYSSHCWKLNQCLYGKIWYVCINADKDSLRYGEWEAFELSGENHWQVFKHPRYATGFYVQSKYAIFHYIQAQSFDANNPDQQTIPWDSMGIKWPLRGKKPILSNRDAKGYYEEFQR